MRNVDFRAEKSYFFDGADNHSPKNIMHVYFLLT